MLQKFKNWFKQKKDSFTRHFDAMENSLIDAKSGKHFIEMELSANKITPKFEDSIRKKYARSLMELKIRVASKEDIDTLQYLYNTSWSVATMPFTPIKSSTLSNSLKNPNISFLIASKNAIDIGFIILKIEENYLKTGNIVGIGVLSENRHDGIGTALGIAAWDFFKSNNTKKLKCKVFSENKIAYTFMKGLGFEEVISTRSNLSQFL